MEYFLPFENETIKVIEEEKITQEVFCVEENSAAGYLNQAIYKLAFSEINISINYLCLDSDSFFVRDFYFDDFMYSHTIPYTVLVEDKELMSDPYYYIEYWEARLKSIKKIEEKLEFFPKKLLTCHGFQVFSSFVIKDLKEKFMSKKQYTFKDLINISPYEFSWYNLWAQKSRIIPIYFCEPHFKTFHINHHIIFSNLQGYNIEDWARGYVGVVINSNFSRAEKLVNYQEIYKYGKNVNLSFELVMKNFSFYMYIVLIKIKKKIMRIFSRN